MRVRNLLAAFALLTMMLVALAPTASAHKTVFSDDGKVKIVWGFLNEPAVTWTKTGLDLILSDNATGTPLEGVDKTLNVSLKHGDDVLNFKDFRGQHGQKGRYTDVVTLTKPGIYTLVLKGTINGTTVDMAIPSAHEIHDVSDTFFPKASSPYALEGRIAALEAKAKTASETPATVTTQAPPTSDVPGFGLVAAGLAAVAVAIVLRRRS